ncbi:MAG: hypothetical protein QXM31_02920 [Candidatus Woesearchaeota archaeon]
MNETIDSKVGGKKQGSPARKFLGAVALYAGLLGIVGGLAGGCASVYYNIRGYKCLMLNKKEHQELSEAVQFYQEAKRQYLCEIARQVRNYVDKNHDGFVTREEAGLLPKGK